MKKNPILYVFTIILLSFTILDVLGEHREFSKVENRKLSEKPKFTLEKFFQGGYTKDFESYVNDQFLLRDRWISLKSISEYALGKIENNNVICGDENYLFDKIKTYDKDIFDKNLDALNKFINESSMSISTILVPNSYEVYDNYLPFGANLLNQKELINKIYSSNLKDRNIDLIKLFNEYKNEYIYYKTDHHWTTYGAYLAYSKYMKSIGESPIILEKFKKNEVEDFYGTYFSKAKKFNAKEDILTYYDFGNLSMEIQGEKFNSIYDYKKLDTRDKYSIFIRGNNGLTIIKNENLKNNKKLIVFKDSFGNSLVPFLSNNFEEIHIVDLRSFPFKVSEYLENRNFDECIVIYSLDNFLNDVNLIRLKY